MAVIVTNPQYKVSADASVDTAWHAFDNKSNTKWTASNNGESGHTLTFQFEKPTTVKAVRFTPSTEAFPTKIELRGSNNTSTDTLIASFTLTTPVPGAHQEFTLNPSVKYSIYTFRLIGASDSSSSSIAISEIEFLLPRESVLPAVVVEPDLQEKSVSPSTVEQTIVPDEGYNGLSKVIVTPAVLQSKSVTPSTSQQIVTPDSGVYGLSKVTVAAAPSTTPKLQAKSVTPSASSQTVTPDSSYDGLSKVTVSGDSNLVASNIKKGVSIFGVSGTNVGSLSTVNVTLETRGVIPDDCLAWYQSLSSDGKTMTVNEVAFSGSETNSAKISMVTGSILVIGYQNFNNQPIYVTPTGRSVTAISGLLPSDSSTNKEFSTFSIPSTAKYLIGHRLGAIIIDGTADLTIAIKST